MLIVHVNIVSKYCSDYDYVGAPALGSSGGRLLQGWGLGMEPALAGVVDLGAVLDRVEAGI